MRACVCLVVAMKYITENSMITVEKYDFALNRQEECWEISYVCNLCLCFDVLNVLPVIILNAFFFSVSTRCYL